MSDFLARAWEQVIGRDHGPLTFRLVLQPLVAAILGVRAGLRHARQGPRPLWPWNTDPARRRERLRESWRDVSRIFYVAIALDLIYQWLVFRWVYLGQLVIVAAVLAIVPYVVIRELTHRAVRWLRAARP